MAEKSKGCVICPHCGELFTALSGKTCKFCNTPEKRAEMDKQNEEIFSKGKTEFSCGYCQREKFQVLQKANQLT